jgi:hypothetical protein
MEYYIEGVILMSNVYSTDMVYDRFEARREDS